MNALKRFWIPLFIVGLALYCAYLAVGVPLARINSIRTYWLKQNLVVSSIRGGKVITHLRVSFPDQAAIAALPSPIYLVDSEGTSFTLADLRKLTWKTEGRTAHAPPTPGTLIRAVYYEPKYSFYEEK